MLGNAGAYEEGKPNNTTVSIGCTIESEDPSDIFSSELKNRENSAPCYDEKSGFQRYDNDSIASGERANFGYVVAYDVEVQMDYGSWAPIIQGHLTGGTTIKKIIIRRVINIKHELVDIQVTTYESCIFKSYKQEGKTIAFSFSYENRQDVTVARDLDGVKIGQYGVDYSPATSTGETAEA
ncbi:MAG: hypothetical protein LBJ45_01015 [Holosporaceae bacterium]|jgi:hypothetical protein|nr:hypothetical protein [Holosporaceae bacterium]